MRIHTKFMLCFAAVVLVMIGFLSSYINIVLVNRVQDEKAEEYSNFLRQLSTSVYLTTRETEQTLFNQYNSRGIASTMLLDQEPVAKALTIQTQLVTVPLNVTNVMSVLAIDQQGNRFFAGKLPIYRPESIENIISPELYDDFTLWLSDGDGNIYLKKDVYQIFPLKYAGIIIAQLDTASFLSSLGLDMRVDGMLAVITEHGKPLAQTGGMTPELLQNVLALEPLTYKPVSRRIALEGKEYWLTMQAAINQSWYTLQLVPVSTMLRMPIVLGRMIWLGSLLIIALAFLLDAVVTHSMTRNVKKLLASMEEVSRGNFETDIPVTSRDEIGELAERFRWMQQELKAVTEKMILRATEKQQAEYEMLELKYRSLQVKISPHFLCNVLSSINALSVMGKNDQVSSLSIQAARYLRDNLDSTDQKFTTLGQEIHFVEEYVELYRKVYQNTFDFQVDICDEAVECKVPSMILQPLVENALVHGLPTGDTSRTYHIRVDGRVEGDELILRVANDGQEVSPQIIETVNRAGLDKELNKKMKGFGLRGVLQRLRLLYGEKQSLHISNDLDGWTSITMHLPFEISDEA